MNKVKKVLAIGLAIGILLLAGCGQGKPAGTSSPAPKAGSGGSGGSSAPAPAGKKITIGVTLPMIEAVHWASQKYGYEDEAKKLGAEVTIVHAGGYQNVEKQVNQIQDFVAKKVSVIVVAATNSDGTVKAVEEAIAAGIPVVNVNVMTNSDKVISKIRSDDYQMGVQQARMLAKALNNKGNVVMVNAPAGTSLAIRGKGFRETIEKEFKDIKILAEQFIPADPSKAMAVMEDYLQTYPNIDGVFTWSDTVGVPVAHVVKAAGKAGKIKITSMDFVNPDMQKAIRDGLVYGTVAQQPIMLGRLGIRTAVAVAKGEKVEKQIFSPILDVTKENMDKIDLSGIIVPK